MSTITLPNIRVGSDLQVRVRLKDGGVAIDWSTLQNIKACIYSDAQRALAGRCAFSIDEEDSTLLVCTYAANKPQYLGVNRIVISAKYMGETKTYDKPAFTFVRWTADQEGEEITIDDPDVDVEITVEDVSSSILQEAVDAAFTAADRANEAAAAAEHMVDIHTGPEGKSAYEVAVEEGYTGTEEEWLASLKGDTGETPDISIGTVTTVAPGTPASASMTGTPEAPVLNLSIPQGVVGATPNFTVGTVTTGEPGSSVIVTITGTPEAPVLNLTIPQGMQGNTGSSVAYPYELVNNLTTNDPTKGLTAAMGVELASQVSQLEAKVTGLSEQVDFSTAPYYVGNLSAAGTWGNTTTYASKYSYYIIPYIPRSTVTITGNATNGTGYVFALDSYSTPSNGDTQTILASYAPTAGQTISFVPPATTRYIYVVRRYYDTSKDFTPVSMSMSATGLEERVADIEAEIPVIEESITDLDKKIFGGDPITLQSANYLYLNGTTIYARSAYFSTSYAQVKAGNYIISFVGNGSIGYADGVAIGYTTNAVANGSAYTPITKREYRQDESIAIPVTIPVDSTILICMWTGTIVDLQVKAMASNDPLYGCVINYVGADINHTYTSLDNALDGAVEGKKTIFYLSAGTYNLSDDWTETEVQNASYSGVAARTEGAWCGTPVKDGTSIIGLDGKDKVIIYAEPPFPGYSYGDISALNFLGEITLQGVTVSSKSLRYTIHDDFKRYNENKTHNIIDCNLFSLSNVIAYGAAKSSGETINFKGCIVDGFGCHAASDFRKPAYLNVEDCIIKYGFEIGDHATGVECPVNLTNVNVVYINYYKNNASDPQKAVLTIHGGNIPAVSASMEKYHHDGMVYKTSTSAISRGTPVKVNGINSVSAMGQNDGAEKFLGIPLVDIPTISTPNKNDYYPIIVKGYVPTSLVGISTFNEGDLVGIVGGIVAVSQTNVIGVIEFTDSGGVGYIRLL